MRIKVVMAIALVAVLQSGCTKPKVDPPLTHHNLASSQSVSLPAEERRHLLDGKCTTWRAIGMTPAPLREAFRVATHEQKFEMADFGEPYQQYDHVERPGLPWRGFILAGICGKNQFVHYHRGGYSPFTAVMVFVPDEQGRLRWEWAGKARPSGDVEELRRQLVTGEFEEMSEVGW